METANGKTTESAMPAENRYGYREGRTERPERSIEEMKRKTFVKQIMAMGVPRNQANEVCRRLLKARDYCQGRGLPMVLTWEYNLMEICKKRSLPAKLAVTASGNSDKLLATWLGKRSKENPVAHWKRNHPNDE